MDIAVLFAGLARVEGVSQADLGRRYRKSPGYVSVLCRLGRALLDVPPEKREVLRAPHFTLRAAQALVSRHPDPAALRAAAETFAARAPTRGRRPRARAGAPGQWNDAPGTSDALDPLPEPRGAPEPRDEFVYRFDADAARRDPAAALAALEAFVRATVDAVVPRLRRAVGDLGPSRAAAASGRRTMGGPLPPAFDDVALRQLNDRVGALLRGHRARLHDFLAERGDSGRRARPGGPDRPGGTLPPFPLDPAEVDADLGEPADDGRA